MDCISPHWVRSAEIEPIGIPRAKELRRVMPKWEAEVGSHVYSIEERPDVGIIYESDAKEQSPAKEAKTLNKP